MNNPQLNLYRGGKAVVVKFDSFHTEFLFHSPLYFNCQQDSSGALRPNDHEGRQLADTNSQQTKPPITVGSSEIVSKSLQGNRLGGNRLGARDKTADTNCPQVNYFLLRNPLFDKFMPFHLWTPL